MTLKVISAEQILFDGQVSLVTLPGESGLFTVLENHASLVSALTKGTIELSKTPTNAQRETWILPEESLMWTAIVVSSMYLLVI